MSSLYELNKQIAEFHFDIDEETGEILNFDELDELKMAREDKIEQLCLYAKNIRAEAGAVKAEKDNFDARYKRLMKKADSIEDYVALNLDGKDFRTSRVECKFRPSEAVEIDDDYAVPDEFVALTIVRKPVKANIKKYIKRAEEDGIEVPWARLVRRNNMTLK